MNSANPTAKDERMSDELAAEVKVVTIQRDSLYDALHALVKTREAEAQAYLSLQNASENFSSSAPERRRYERACTDSSNAEREARVLLLTMKKTSLTIKPTKPAKHPCKAHPDAPHGFDRQASHNAGRYVCDCESWQPTSADAR